jgi:hypothetical protein
MDFKIHAVQQPPNEGLWYGPPGLKDAGQAVTYQRRTRDVGKAAAHPRGISPILILFIVIFFSNHFQNHFSKLNLFWF